MRKTPGQREGDPLRGGAKHPAVGTLTERITSLLLIAILYR